MERRDLAGLELFSHRFENGLMLVGEALPGARAAAFQFLIPAGAVTDPEGGLGAAGLLEDLSFRGAGDLDSRELSAALDALGLQRGSGANGEYSTYSGSLLAEDLFVALGLYADILQRPHLPEDSLEASKAIALHRIESLEDHPTQLLFVRLQEAFFPGPHGRCSL